MSLITVRRPAETRSLVTRAMLETELGIDVDTIATEERLDRLIEEASGMVEDYTDRIFAREEITEKFGVHDGDLPDGFNSRLMLKRTPVLMIEAIRFDGVAINLDDVSIANPDAGFVYRETGFSSTTLRRQSINRVPTRHREPLWEVDYTGGYILPSFSLVSETFAGGDVDTDADTITVTAHGLLSGDTVRFSTDGTLPGGLTAGRDYFVRDEDADSFKVTESLGGDPVDLTSAGSGTHTVQRRTTLPAGLQRDVLQVAISLYKQGSRDPAIQSEKLGDWSAQYAGVDGGGVPPAVAARLERYRDLV